MLNSGDSELLRGLLVEVNRYRRGSLSFYGLVGLLSAALAPLSREIENVKGQLQALWGELEQINALALFVDEDPPLDEHRAEVETLLQEIVQLVETELHRGHSNDPKFE